MDTQFQLFRVKTADRAGVITTVAACLASRGVNIESFAASDFGEEAGDRSGNFLIIVEANSEYAKVLKKLMGCLEVVTEVSDPEGLDADQMKVWREKFGGLDRI